MYFMLVIYWLLLKSPVVLNLDYFCYLVEEIQEEVLKLWRVPPKGVGVVFLPLKVPLSVDKRQSISFYPFLPGIYLA